MSGPTPEFVASVKHALEHLYDPVCLEDHALSQRLLPRYLPPETSRVEALRQALLDGIDHLNPGPLIAADSRARRSYQILELRYVEGLLFREVIEELAISQAQYHRDLRHSLQALATLLWEKAVALKDTDAPPPDMAASAFPRSTSESLDSPPTDGTSAATGDSTVDLPTTIRGVVEILREVVRDSGVELVEKLPSGPLAVSAERTILRQVLLSLSSCLLEQAHGAALSVSCRSAGGEAVVEIVYEGELPEGVLESNEVSERLGRVEMLLKPLGGALSLAGPPGPTVVRVTFPLGKQVLLIIDDDADTILLTTRLLANQGWTVLSCGSVRAGIDLARQSQPNAILLDVLMPGQDGWDALQALKQDPATQDIPVLVSSVLEETRLARALGASEFVRKPLSRSSLVEVLARWTRPSARQVPEYPEPIGSS